jgi:opine dehydrogenase
LPGTGFVLTACICGGGSLSHALAAVLGAAGVKLNVLTRRPEAWSKHIKLLYGENAVIGPIAIVSSNPQDVVTDADIVIINVPFFARPRILAQISPYVSEGAWVGAFPATAGFFWVALSILGARVLLFGTDRVPYVRQTVDYGSRVLVTGIRKGLLIAVNPSSRCGEVASLLSQLLSMPMTPVQSSLGVTLTPTNPTMHPARVYSIFGRYPADYVFSSIPYFIAGWTDEASELFLQMDEELQCVCRSLPVDLACVKTLLQHYEIPNASLLTWRIRSISAQATRMAPMRKVVGGYAINLQSPYLQEDFPYGLAVLRAVAELAGVTTPTMDKLLHWYERISSTQLFAGDSLRGRDARGLPLPWNFGISTSHELVASSTR